jgi:hypothetical protein
VSDGTAAASVAPLHQHDPPTLGGVRLVGRLSATDTGIVYAGQISGRQVAVAMLTEGAELDSYARARFLQARNLLVAASASDVDTDIAPWVAVPADTWGDGLASAMALLAPVSMEHVPPMGTRHGPEFRPHWTRRDGVGRWRIWPLPWPESLAAANRWTYVASLALVVAIAAIALLIAVRIFQNQAPAPPGPGPGPVPLPTPVSPSPSPSPTPSPSPKPTQSPGGTLGPGPTVTGAPPIV